MASNSNNEIEPLPTPTETPIPSTATTIAYTASSSSLITPHDFIQLIRDHEILSIIKALGSVPDAAYAESLIMSHDEEGHTALHWISYMGERPEFIEVILAYISNKKKKLDIRSYAKLQYDQTPLHWACIQGNIKTVSIFLKHGANPYLVDCNGYNALIHASQYGHVETMHILLKHYPDLLNSLDHTGNSCIQWASYYNHISIIRYIYCFVQLQSVQHLKLNINHLDHLGHTALYRACSADQIENVEMLLRCGADIHIRNDNGLSIFGVVTKQSRCYKLMNKWKIESKRNWIKSNNGKTTAENNNNNNNSNKEDIQRGRNYEAWLKKKRYHIKNYSLVIFYYVFLFVCLSLYYTFIIKKHADLIRINTHLALLFFSMLSIVFNFISTFGNPGDIQSMTNEQFISYIDSISTEKKNNTSSVQLLPSSYCYFCLCQKPKRSRHSRLRNSCVKKFDHECPWVNNSVGLYTHKSLLLLVITLSISQLIFLYAIFKVLIFIYQQQHQQQNEEINFVFIIFDQLFHYPFIATTVLLNVFILTFNLFLFLSQIKLIFQGSTTFETISQGRRRKVQCNINKNSSTQHDEEAQQEREQVEETDQHQQIGNNALNSLDNDTNDGCWHNTQSFITSSGSGTDHPFIPLTLSSFLNSVIDTFWAPWKTHFSSGSTPIGHNLKTYDRDEVIPIAQ